VPFHSEINAERSEDLRLLTAVTQSYDAPDALSGLLGDRGRALGNADRGLTGTFRHGGGSLRDASASLGRALDDALADLLRALDGALHRPTRFRL